MPNQPERTVKVSLRLINGEVLEFWSTTVGNDSDKYISWEDVKFETGGVCSTYSVPWHSILDICETSL